MKIISVLASTVLFLVCSTAQAGLRPIYSFPEDYDRILKGCEESSEDFMNPARYDPHREYVISVVDGKLITVRFADLNPQQQREFMILNGEKIQLRIHKTIRDWRDASRYEEEGGKRILPYIEKMENLYERHEFRLRSLPDRRVPPGWLALSVQKLDT